MNTPSAYAKFQQAGGHLERLKKALQQPGKDFEDSLFSFLAAFESTIDLYTQESNQAPQRRDSQKIDYKTPYEKWRESLSEKDRVLLEDLKRQRNKDTHHVKGMGLPTEGESVPLQDVRSFFPPEIFELAGIRPEQVNFADMAGYAFIKERLIEVQNKCEQGLRLLQCLLQKKVTGSWAWFLQGCSAIFCVGTLVKSCSSGSCLWP